MNNFVVAHVNLARGFRGGERQTELLIQKLSEMGLKQIFICRKESPLVDHLKDVKDLEIITLSKVLDFRVCGHRVLGKRCDLIQAHETRAVHWAFIHHLLYGVPYVFTRRVPELVRNNFLNKKMYASAASVVAISKSIAVYLEQQFNLNVEIIPSSCAHFNLNKNAIENLKSKYKNYYVIGQVGALVDKHKGQSVLIEAARILKEKIPNLKVLFLGDGEDKDKLESLARDLINEKIVEFVGFVKNVGDYINIMDVFAYPSNYEGLGSVLLDVMEQGVPIVASAVDGIPDIVKQGKTGLLIQRGNAFELSDAIMNIKQSARLREEFIINSKIMAKEHSPEHMAESYIKLYERILN